MNNYLYSYITDFFVRYLPNQRGFSKNTITSYKYTFILLLEYFEKKYSIKASNLKVSDLTEKEVIKFIEYLEIEKENSISTTNQRLCAIHSFCKYLQKKDVIYLELTSNILKIQTKKVQEKDIYYLSKEEVKKLFEVFDINDKKQLRDYTITSLIYDSGARVQEIINLKVSDINFENKTIKVVGKGNKVRIIPIFAKVIDVLKIYLKEYKIYEENDNLVFFNSRKDKLTREGIKYILKKYAKMANLDYKKISPHVFRHTKAMHLLENDVNLIYIRDFLGHKSVTTTEIYARANPEVKRKAIENLSDQIIDKGKYSISEKNELLNWLKESL